MYVESISTRQAFVRYVVEGNFKTDGTKSQYTPKIDRFSEIHSILDVSEAITANLMVKFIYSDGNPKMALAALEHFYDFVYSILLHREQYPPFPVNTKLLRKEFGKDEDDDYAIGYLDPEFDFTELFNDDYYDHLHDQKAIITLKACIAVCLGAAYGTSEIETLTVSDFEVVDGLIKVKNKFPNYQVPWISFNEELSKMILSYFDLRRKDHYDNDLFFIKIWSAKDTRKINPDPNIWLFRKPTEVKEWLSYILMYISYRLNLSQRISIKHIRANTIFHYLLRTNGRGLENVLRTFGGWKKFVQKSCDKYFEIVQTIESPPVFDVQAQEAPDDSRDDYFFLFPHRK